MFENRFDAARQLVKRLEHYRGKDCVVLAVPRGGVEVGYVVARELGFPLDVVFTKKIGYPGNEEYAIGAVGIGGSVVSEGIHVPGSYLDAEKKRIGGLLKERQNLYYGGRKPHLLNGKVAIIVDDGIATGNTMIMTVQLVRKSSPGRVVVAVPVAPPDAVERLAAVADEVVCLDTPGEFFAIGNFYVDFRQVEDEEALRMLREANRWA